ncbi:MAG: histidine kinase, partial [Bacteroidota bacterium]
LAALLILIVKAWYAIRKKNKQIALQSLRREMNPHFLFNSLNSVNQFIAGNNELAANKYLSSYAGLMRRIMENSNKDFISLGSELEQLTKYLDLEKLRFSEKFDYTISIDPKLDKDTIMVPNMIIQPNLENAIWHGLRYRETKGLLHIAFTKEDRKTCVTISDNGIGYAQSKLLKTDNQKQYESRGLHNVEERINLLNQLNKSHITMDMFDKSTPETGVIVTIKWQA